MNPSHNLGFFKDVHGFISDDDRRTIQEAVLECHNIPGDAIEIGCLHGLSTLVTLSVLSPNKRMTVIDVNRYPEFFANLGKYGVFDRVDFHQGDYSSFGFVGPYSTAFIDHCHTFEDTVKCFSLLSSKMSVGGKILIHDVGHKDYPDVVAAVLEIEKNHPNFEFEFYGFTSVFKKKGQ